MNRNKVIRRINELSRSVLSTFIVNWKEYIERRERTRKMYCPSHDTIEAFYFQFDLSRSLLDCCYEFVTVSLWFYYSFFYILMVFITFFFLLNH